MNHQLFQKQKAPAVRMIRSTILDAALGGACAASYGIVFAGFGAAGQGDSERIVTTIVYFGLCGAIGGGVFGTISALIDVVEPHRATDRDNMRFRDIADVAVPVDNAQPRFERAKYMTLASKSHQEQLEMRMSRILGPQVPRVREPFQSNFADCSQWDH